MSDYIPTDLVPDILARLPVESLVRFTSVCKTWCSLITSPSFINKHLNCSKTKAKNLLLKGYNCETREERYLLCRGKRKLSDKFSQLEPPFSTGNIGYGRIVGSCNGLLCITYFSLPSCIILWNPVIRISVTLPMPFRSQWYFLGFGAHPTTHEYILVYIDCTKVGSTVELYTQGQGSWKSITSVCHSRQIWHSTYSSCSQAVVNGAIHWIALEGGLMDDYCRVITLFNMVSQAFSVMMMPLALVSNIPSESDLSIMSYGESLGVLCAHWKVSCCIWVMKDYGVAESWAKVYNISLQRMSIIGFRESGDFLASTMDKQLICYDHETKTWTNAGYTGSSTAFAAVNFKESLVLMERQNIVL